MPLVRVGYVIPSEKWNSMNFEKLFSEPPLSSSVHLIKIDPLIDFSEQEDVEVIIHKIHDYLVEDARIESHKDVWNICRCFSLEAEQRGIVLLDSIESIDILTNRALCMMVVKQCSVSLNNITMSCPNFFTYDINKNMNDNVLAFSQSGVTFPVVVKPLCAGDDYPRYDMSIFFDPRDKLEEKFMNHLPNYNCLVQQFYNHGGRMYKIYVIGNSWYVNNRPSLMDLNFKSESPIHFKSNSISKVGAKSHLISHLPEQSPDEINDRTGGLDSDVITSFICELRKNFQFCFIGIDIIVGSLDGNYYVVDVNYFPGYRNPSDMGLLLNEAIQNYKQFSNKPNFMQFIKQV